MFARSLALFSLATAVAPPKTEPRAVAGLDRIPAIQRRHVVARRFSPVQITQTPSTPNTNSPRNHTIAPRVRTDPIDPQRVVISGSPAQVCAALERLVARQEASRR